MAQEEKYGVRDLTYSAWHRRLSTARFVGIEKATLLHMIDIDAVPWTEYGDDMKMPLALIETAEDVGQAYKTATVTRNLASLASLPSLVVLYRKSQQPNPYYPDYQDIEHFRVKRLTPQQEWKWRDFSPEQYAWLLLAMRGWSARRIDEEFFNNGD